MRNILVVILSGLIFSFSSVCFVSDDVSAEMLVNNDASLLNSIEEVKQSESQFVVAEGYKSNSNAQFQNSIEALEIAQLPTYSSLKDVENAIINAVEKLQTEFSFTYSGDAQRLSSVLLSTIESVQSKHDYALGTITKYGYSRLGSNFKITFEYTTAPEQQAFVSKEIDRILKEIIKPNMSDLQKVMVINDYIVKNTTYSYNTKTTPHASYALFKEGKGVCQAYAMAAYEMLTKAGLKAHYVTGFTDEYHAWNLVEIDGEWYHLDTTWNDPVIAGDVLSNFDQYISYQYFLLSDATILKERKMDERVNLPKAKSERFKVFRTIDSVPLLYMGKSFLLTPEYDGADLFFLDYHKGELYQIDLTKNPLEVKTFASLNALQIKLAPSDIYYIDMRTRGLYKINRQTKAITKLVDQSAVDNLKINQNKLQAFRDNKLIFEEDILLVATNEKIKKMIEEATNLVKSIDYYAKDFPTRGKQVVTFMESLDASMKAALPTTLKAELEKIIEMYNKMTALASSNSKEFGKMREISDSLKPWTVTLSMNVKNSASNLNKIQVVDLFGNPIEVKISIAQDKITVKPLKQYAPGVQYKLVIQAGLESETGNKLKTSVHLPFTFVK